jgi:hypothetical protein
MTKKLGKIKPRVNPDGDISREDARKIAQEIYQMYDVTSKIAVDLGKDEEYFMINPDDWRNDPNWMAQEMYTGMLLSGYDESTRNYNEALKMCGTNLSKHGQTAAIREKYGKRKGPPMSAKSCPIGHKVMWEGEEYVVNKGHRWSKVARRKSSKRKSPKRKSPKRKSPKRKSPKRKSPKRKSPKRKSPKRKSPKRKSPKRKSPKRKKSLKKTVAQRRKECKAQGLVYDTKTKRCRESKRKRRKSPKRKSPKRKSPKRKSPKRKSPKRKSSRRKKSPKKTVAQRRKECKAQGLVYDTKTKRCRESKRKRRKSPKR